MATTAELPNIAQRINAAMSEVDYIQKERKQGMNYSIVSHDAVTAKCRPILQKHGIVYYPHSLDVRQSGNRTEALFQVRFENMDDRADYIDVATFGYGVDAQDKGPGKAMSYGVKYALLKVLGLETGDDPDEVQDARSDHKPANEDKPSLKKQLEDSIDQETNGKANKRDAPFPKGPAKNKTELKRLGSDLWRDVEACGDPDQLDALLATHKELQTQISQALPLWWNGGTHASGEPYEGLATVIAKRQSDLAVAVLNAG